MTARPPLNKTAKSLGNDRNDSAGGDLYRSVNLETAESLKN
jgi:hypothetical protein